MDSNVRGSSAGVAKNRFRNGGERTIEGLKRPPIPTLFPWKLIKKPFCCHCALCRVISTIINEDARQGGAGGSFQRQNIHLVFKLIQHLIIYSLEFLAFFF